ncbi:hypothetical protein PAP_01610 [Palaeococcus pacificus DY20341]|uniref:Phosphatidate cytidylyltransferase n=1 Tax=Palaeococcus pacificus DY20341 TaxID=1343739 RepID=A0A075LRM1_9EURY|nr:hypothetical protein [Palaeococcus pacificus]AIF68761.1 hypothetical protein PAP_01610 [Palaeococcus pacificus DY20341]
MRGTWDLVLIVYIYVFSVIWLGQYLRKGYSADTTRRIVHILAGDIIVVLPLFASLKWVLTIPLGLAVIVLVAFMLGLPIKHAMVPEGDDPLHAYGPVYYIISIGILVGIFGTKSFIPIVATFVMAWGDGFAALMGRKFGKRRIINGKTLEGSLAFLLFSLLGVTLSYTLWAYFTSSSINDVLSVALLSSISGTIFELLSVGKFGAFDNFTVPLGVALVLRFTF